MFIPTTPEEVRSCGWKGLDIILVSGDTYTDNAYNGTALIGHWLVDHGLRVGIIAQPDVSSGVVGRNMRAQTFISMMKSYM